MRYTRPEMGALAAAETLAEKGGILADASQAFRQNDSFNLNRIHEIKREVRYDVIAFTTAVAEKMKLNRGEMDTADRALYAP